MCWSRGWRRATNTSWQARNIKTCNRYCRLNIYVISSCHRTEPECNTGNIFRVFRILQFIPRAFRRVKYMRNKGNICQYSTREHAITALSSNACISNTMTGFLAYFLTTSINPFAPNAPFLYPLFQWSQKGCIGNE